MISSANKKSVRTRKSKKPGVSIIGAGRLGIAIGRALRNAGYPIRLAVTGHPRTASRAARRIGPGVAGISIDQLSSLKSEYLHALRQSSLIMISTPDDVVRQTATTLAGILEKNPFARKPGPIALHVSGALSSKELRSLKRLGLATGSFHPLVSVTDDRRKRTRFQNSFFCVEGDAKAVRMARRLARDLGGRTFTIDSGNKALYHAAAVMAAGNLVALFDLAIALLVDCGLSRPTAQQVLLPLIQSSIANVESSDTTKALSGPLVRGDISIVKKHLDAMKAPRLALALASYKALGRQTLSVLANSQRRPSNLKELEALLSGR